MVKNTKKKENSCISSWITWINILVLIFTSEFISAFIESVSFSFCDGFHTLKDYLKNAAENWGWGPSLPLLEWCFMPWRCIFCREFFHFKLKMYISQWLWIFKMLSLQKWKHLHWFRFVPLFPFDANDVWKAIEL